MTTSAFGVVMVAVAVQSSIIQTSFPPFGIASSSFEALASYLFSLGFYCSAVSVSQADKLRRSIRVLKITKEQQEALTEQTGVEPSLTEDEVKQYLTRCC